MLVKNYMVKTNSFITFHEHERMSPYCFEVDLFKSKWRN